MDTGAYYSGDLIFEYLCLEKSFSKKRMLERFRFFTGNPPQDNDESKDTTNHEEADKLLKDFLKTFHYPEGAIQSFVTAKDDNDAKELLQKQIDDPVCFHIQHKHRKVLNALRKNADELEVEPFDHTKNLIKSLAYVEGVSLKGSGEPEPPSIDLLRALLEAFEKKIIKSSEQEGGYLWNTRKAREEHFKNKNKDFDANGLKLNDLLDPYAKNQKDIFYNFKLAHKHYAHMFDSAYAITSQEIHHNDRPRFADYRLQLVVYGICELLLFYQNTIKGDPIKPTDEDRKRSKINDLAHFLDHKGGWTAIRTLKLFSQYLDGIDLSAQGLSSLGFEVNHKTKKFKIVRRNNIAGLQ